MTRPSIAYHREITLKCSLNGTLTGSVSWEGAGVGYAEAFISRSGRKYAHEIPHPADNL